MSCMLYGNEYQDVHSFNSIFVSANLTFDREKKKKKQQKG